MAQEEVYGSRDRSYSAWHRRKSIGRFVGIEIAQTLGMIDLDGALWIEYDDGTKEPLALIETAQDVGQDYKNATVTLNLARRCTPTLPAAIVLYKLGPFPNPSDSGAMDIDSFRVKRIWPEPASVNWTHYTAQEWAEALVRLRQSSSRELDKWLMEDAGYFDNVGSPPYEKLHVQA